MTISHYQVNVKGSTEKATTFWPDETAALCMYVLVWSKRGFSVTVTPLEK